MERITVQRHADTLHALEWRFWFDDRKCRLVLDDYIELERLSTRHKFKVVGRYERIDKRKNTIADPPLPADIMEEAKQLFFDQLTVVKD